ncbi:MAG: hypothetical protein ACK500_14550 [Flavobacteriales bacterium]|jgi:hypothetical protein
MNLLFKITSAAMVLQMVLTACQSRQSPVCHSCTDSNALGIKITLTEKDRMTLGSMQVINRESGYSCEKETDVLGKIAMSLCLDSMYDLVFTKENYLQKIIRLDLRNIPDTSAAGGFQVDMNISMQPAPEGFDARVTDEPIGIASYSPEQYNILFDLAYTENRQKQIDAELRRCGAKQ